MRKRVYVAGPYSHPDPCINTHNACLAWRQLWDAGLAPFCPHWSHFQHFFSPMPYQDWLSYDLEWLRLCDCVLRLPGKSKGADMETDEAKRLGIPVLRSVEEVVMWAKDGENETT